MQKLQLPEYSFPVIIRKGKSMIFDDFRKKWVVLTPEEWVRQNFLRYLVAEKKFPPALMAVEKKTTLNRQARRFDLLVYDRQGEPWLIGEFKAPEVEIRQEAFDQAIRYNTVLQAPYFLVSNGLKHFICRVDFAGHRAVYLEAVPEYGTSAPRD